MSATKAVPNLAQFDLRWPLALATACFFVWGIAYGLLDVLNKHFQDTLGVGKAASTLLQIAYFGAYLTMSLPAGQLLHRFGYKAGLATGLIVTALGAFLFIPSASAASFPFFVGSMFVLATGLTVLETSADTYVNVLGPPEHSERRLNLAQSFNGLGAFLGPVIGGAMFFGADKAGGADGLSSVQTTYAVIGVAVLVFAAIILRARLPEIEDAHVHESDAPADRLFHRRHFVFGVTTQALYIGAQVGIGALFINAVVELWPGLGSREGAYLLSLALGGFLVGRFFTTALMLRFPPRGILVAYGLINLLLALLVAQGLGKVSVFALIGCFFFMSTMFATIFTLGVKDLGPHTKRGSALMVMAIGGGVLLPYPMGWIADQYGTHLAFYLPAACFAIVALYGWKGAEVR
jgi:MFS transporter, FHS family, L-fucose permease